MRMEFIYLHKKTLKLYENIVFIYLFAFEC
jgi:hypothetical protein